LDIIATQSRIAAEGTMPVIWSAGKTYRRVEYDSEADLETAIIEVQHRLFGANRHYLDVKNRIGIKGSIQNIPDGYLLDLSGSKPRLYVVENELESHDPLRHIAVQILQFSLSFEEERLGVKKVLVRALEKRSEIRKACEEYATRRKFRNVDHLLEYLVESPFSALVIIDAVPENLEAVLSKKFNFGVSVLELARYESETGERLYHFEPFLEEVVGELPSPEVSVAPVLNADEIDTIVVPAQAEGFQEVFLGENRWYSVRINGSVRPQIKYIASYQVAPVQAVTHFARVKSIEPWKDSGKFVLNFDEPAQPIGPIPIVKGGKVKGPQSPRYTNHERLMKAKNLDELFNVRNGDAAIG
jgi:hypothetical protein